MKRIFAPLMAGLLVTWLGSSFAGASAAKPFAGPQVSGRAAGTMLGALWWGSNAGGQLGPKATTVTSSNPIPVVLDGYLRSMAAGASHVLANLGDGRVYAWGATDLYTGAAPGPVNPTPHQVLLPAAAKQVAAGSVASYVLTEEGDLYSFGYNVDAAVTPDTAGQLGLGTTDASSNTSSPTRVSLGSLVAIDAKCDNAAALSDYGILYVWGSNVNGQLGQGSAGGSSGVPNAVNMNGMAVVAMAVGCDFMLALTNRGEVYAWGHNDQGQLGLGDTMDRYAPTRVAGVSRAVSIAAGNNHALAIMPDGTMAAWGRNDYGQLGIGSFATPQTSPVQVPGVSTAIGVAAGDLHSTLISQSNTGDAAVYSSTGDNTNGQLGAYSAGTPSASSFTAQSFVVSPPTMRRAGFTPSSYYDWQGNFVETPRGGEYLWRDADTMQIGTGYDIGFRSLGYVPGWNIVGMGDTTQDDLTEIFWHNPSTGDLAYWSVNFDGQTGPLVRAQELIGFRVDPSTGWRPQKVADLDGDGVADILWRNVVTGDLVVWYMAPYGQLGYIVQLGWAGLDWAIVAAADVDGNHAADIIWRNTVTGQVFVWLKNSLHRDYRMASLGFVPTSSQIQVVADLDGDGRADLFWRDGSSGDTFIWYMSGTSFQANSSMTVGLEWNAVAFVDSGISPHLFWRSSNTGQFYTWSYDSMTFVPGIEGHSRRDPYWIDNKLCLSDTGPCEQLLYRPAPGETIMPFLTQWYTLPLNWQIEW